MAESQKQFGTRSAASKQEGASGGKHTFLGVIFGAFPLSHGFADGPRVCREARPVSLKLTGNAGKVRRGPRKKKSHPAWLQLRIDPPWLPAKPHSRGNHREWLPTNQSAD